MFQSFYFFSNIFVIHTKVLPPRLTSSINFSVKVLAVPISAKKFITKLSSGSGKWRLNANMRLTNRSGICSWSLDSIWSNRNFTKCWFKCSEMCKRKTGYQPFCHYVMYGFVGPIGNWFLLRYHPVLCTNFSILSRISWTPNHPLTILALIDKYSYTSDV